MTILMCVCVCVFIVCVCLRSACLCCWVPLYSYKVQCFNHKASVDKYKYIVIHARLTPYGRFWEIHWASVKHKENKKMMKFLQKKKKLKPIWWNTRSWLLTKSCIHIGNCSLRKLTWTSLLCEGIHEAVRDCRNLKDKEKDNSKNNWSLLKKVGLTRRLTVQLMRLLRLSSLITVR